MRVMKRLIVVDGGSGSGGGSSDEISMSNLKTYYLPSRMKLENPGKRRRSQGRWGQEFTYSTTTKTIENWIKKESSWMVKFRRRYYQKRGKSELETIESSGMGYVEVGEGLTIGMVKKWTKCVVVREFTKGLESNLTFNHQ